MMQSAGQLSRSLLLPSSQVSVPETLPLPHDGIVQLASQPGVLCVTQKPRAPLQTPPPQVELLAQMAPGVGPPVHVPPPPQPVLALQVDDGQSPSERQRLPWLVPPTH